MAELESGPRSAIDDLIGGLFGVGRVSRARMAEAGARVVSDAIRARFPAAGAAVAAATGRPAPAPPAGPRRPSPEAIQRRKANLAARGALGFDPDEPLTEQQIRKRRQELARLYHTDGQAPDPTRQEMIRKINNAGELLIETARAARSG